MAKTLSKTGISTGQDILAGHVTQSVDALTGTEAYDIIGNRLQTTNETTISLRDYSKGIYILKVAYGDRAQEFKVIKD